jgi:hypothetical protein
MRETVGDADIACPRGFINRHLKVPGHRFVPAFQALGKLLQWMRSEAKL